MITKWKVFNFKSIREETELELGPLTIFAGANSSGKSTFIQSILLIAQTLSHKVSDRSVVLNGALASLGQYDDLKATNGNSSQITVGFTCRPAQFQDSSADVRYVPIVTRGSLYMGFASRSVQEVSAEISFDDDPSNPQRELALIQPRLFASQLNCVTRDEDNVDQISSITIHPSDSALFDKSGIEYVDGDDDRIRAGLAYSVNLDDKSLSEIAADYVSATPVGCVLRHFLPERLIYRVDNLKEMARNITLMLQTDPRRVIASRRSPNLDIRLSAPVISVIRDVLGDAVKLEKIFSTNQMHMLFFPNETQTLALREWLEFFLKQSFFTRTRILNKFSECEDLFGRIYNALKASTQPDSDLQSFVSAKPPRQILAAANFLENTFASSFKYLGPLRDSPKPVYPLAPSADPRDIGLRGEHTAAVLELHKNTRIRYLPSANFVQPIVNHKIATRTLQSAVIDWLQYMGVADSVQSKDMGKFGHSLKVSIDKSGTPHDLTHVGVGVSQVLPILVSCLLADTDATLVFEQPELHLHPKVQTLLGDFFLSMALCNKQCIVETHSEYLIDRLRFRCAANPSEANIHKKTKMYFVKKPEDCSIFLEINVNEYGAIQEWPEGFFDQSQEQAEQILRAALDKQRRIKSLKGK